MTSTGLILGPLSLLLVLLPWRYSIIALVSFATLDSAAIVNAGSFGLQPGYFFGLLMIGRTLVEVGLLGTPLNAYVARMLVPLLLFAITCFISIWVGLTFFQGELMVIGSTAGLDLHLAQPYSFQRQNLTQPFYLLLNLGIVYALAHQIARMPAHEVVPTLDRAVLGAILFASLVAVWEMAAFYGGLRFFPGFFHSNVGYASSHGQVLTGGILRVSGPFSEPSSLAYHFAAFLLYGWYRHLHQPTTGSLTIVLLCLVMLAVSTSTTAFAVIGVFLVLITKDTMIALCSGRFALSFSGRHVGMVVLLGLVALATTAFVHSNWEQIDTVLTRMLFEKHQSSSFAERRGVDLMAIDIVMETGGIGIGLGSHKPNNLAMTLLSNTGIAGTLLFGFFLLQLLRSRRMPLYYVDVRPYRWLIAGLMIVHAVSNPNLNPIILWIGFGLVIGALAVERMAQGVAAGDRELQSPLLVRPVANAPLP